MLTKANRIGDGPMLARKQNGSHGIGIDCPGLLSLTEIHFKGLAYV